MTITAAEFHDAFPDMGRQHAEARLKEAIDSPLGQVSNHQERGKTRRVPLGAVPGAVFQR